MQVTRPACNQITLYFGLSCSERTINLTGGSGKASNNGGVKSFNFPSRPSAVRLESEGSCCRYLDFRIVKADKVLRAGSAAHAREVRASRLLRPTTVRPVNCA